MLGACLPGAGELDCEIDPDQLGKLAISLLQGLLIHVRLYGAEVDIMPYARAAVTMIGPARPAPSYCNARSGSSFAARCAGR